MKHSIRYHGFNINKIIGILLLMICSEWGVIVKHKYASLDHWWWEVIVGIGLGIIIAGFNLFDYKSGEIKAFDKGWDGRPL